LGTVKEIREQYGKLMQVDGVAVMQNLDGNRSVVKDPSPAAPAMVQAPTVAPSYLTD
jgi:hypothetical protein